jgi:hypothetical protein
VTVATVTSTQTVATTEQTTTTTGAPTTSGTTVDYDTFLASLGLVLGAPPVEADVTGDGRPEALITAHIPDCGSCHARSFFVMNGATILFNASGEGWLEPTPSGVIFEWISPVAMPGESLCCPSWFSVESYRWDGTVFRTGDNVRLRHFLEVNDMPITGPLEPSEQVATVVLYYSLMERGRFTQAFNLMSSALQDHYHFEAWAAGNSTTKEIIVESVATVGSPDMVGVRFRATSELTSGAVTTTFEGTWTLVEENGRWLLDWPEIDAVAP